MEMDYQQVFKRYELKYMLNSRQKEALLEAMAGHMQLDQYGLTTIRNIYYDTDDFRLIRASLMKPVYKEKLRIRSYGRAGRNDMVFVELKKKYDSVVYKRRLSMPQADAMNCLNAKIPLPEDSQISREIDYFNNFYENLHPAAFVSYDREAYYSTDGGDLRITFDRNIRGRTEELSLDSEAYGTRVIGDDMTLVEVKTGVGYPLWFARTLAEQHAYKGSFSKYGRVYETVIYPRLTGQKPFLQPDVTEEPYWQNVYGQNPYRRSAYNGGAIYA
jgi:hypothetical protein